MPQSLANVVLRITFSTKERRPFLQKPEYRGKAIGYLIGTLKNLDCPSIITNAVEDHVHILCNLSRTISIADLISKIKSSSSEHIKTIDRSLSMFYWQLGYGAFSVSQSNIPQVKRYIANQEEHHKKTSFQDEFRELCKRHNIEIDERYVWD